MKRVIADVKKQGLIPFLKENLFTNKGTKQTIVKNTFWLMLAEAVNKGALLISSVLIARYLGVEPYGLFSFAFSFVAILAITADLGLTTLMIREIAKNRNDAQQQLSNIAALKVALGFLCMGVLVLITHFMNQTSQTKYAIYILGAYTILNSITEFLRAIFRAFEKIEYEAYSKILNGMVLVTLVYLCTAKKLPLQSVLFSYLIAAALSIIFTTILIRKYFVASTVRANKEHIIATLREAWPFLVGSICTVVYFNIDSVLLGIYRTFQEVGLYQSAFKIFALFQTINLINVVIFPRLTTLYQYKEYAKYKRLLSTTIKLSLQFLIPLGIVLSIFSQSILVIIFGSSFVQAYPVFILLTWAGIINFYNALFGNALIATGKTSAWAGCVFAGMIINVLLNILVIPTYGMIGAGVAALATQAIILIALIYLSRSTRKII